MKYLNLLILPFLFICCGTESSPPDCNNTLLGSWQFTYANDTCEGEVFFEDNCHPDSTNVNCGVVEFTQIEYTMWTLVFGDYDVTQRDYEYNDKQIFICCGDDGIFNYEVNCNEMTWTREDDCSIRIEFKRR